jgi:hypothetical protein
LRLLNDGFRAFPSLHRKIFFSGPSDGSARERRSTVLGHRLMAESLMKNAVKVALVAMMLLGPVAASAQQSEPAQPEGLTLERYLPRAKKKMLKLDTDKDGRISSAEYDARKVSDPKKKAKRFKRLDANQDGFADDAEMRVQAEREFKHMDKDGNGVLTAEERTSRKRPAATQ